MDPPIASSVCQELATLTIPYIKETYIISGSRSTTSTITLDTDSDSDNESTILFTHFVPASANFRNDLPQTSKPEDLIDQVSVDEEETSNNPALPLITDDDNNDDNTEENTAPQTARQIEAPIQTVIMNFHLQNAIL